jgi:hypothetical protein
MYLSAYSVTCGLHGRMRKTGWISYLGFSPICVCLRQDISGMSESKRGSEKIRTNALCLF